MFFLQPLFAFLYKEQFPVDGWKVYDPTSEYKRQVRARKLCLWEFIKDFSQSKRGKPSWEQPFDGLCVN